MKKSDPKLNLLKKWDRIMDKIIGYVERMSKRDKDFKSLRNSVYVMDAFERSNFLSEVISSGISKMTVFSDKMRRMEKKPKKVCWSVRATPRNKLIKAGRGHFCQAEGNC